MKVLIVEDNDLSRKLLRATLSAEGVSVVEATDGTAALAILDAAPVDAIISDILMPGMDGYRLCSAVRAHRKRSRVPFIMYSATYLTEADRKLATDCGADVFLEKPASAEKLMETLRALTKGSRKPKDAARPAEETEVLREYSQVLVHKLEQKNHELSAANRALEDKNAALKEMLGHLEAEKKRIQEQVVANVETVVLPALKKLRVAAGPAEKQRLDLLEKSLRDLTAGFGRALATRFAKLSPKEVEVCDLIKKGLASKEIARLLNLSEGTVEAHRNRIRKKLNISRQEVNLVSFLKTLE